MASGHGTTMAKRQESYQANLGTTTDLVYRYVHPVTKREFLWTGGFAGNQITLIVSFDDSERKRIQTVLRRYEPPPLQSQQRDVPRTQKRKLLEWLKSGSNELPPSTAVQLAKIVCGEEFKTAPQGYSDLGVAAPNSKVFFRDKEGTLTPEIAHAPTSAKKDSNQLLQTQIKTPPEPHSLDAWLKRSSNIVLEGVPGTGKTYAIGALTVAHQKDGKPVPGTGIRELSTASARRLPLASGTQYVPVEVRFMTMHPSTSYEDFVEGLRPVGSWKNATASKKVIRGTTTMPFDDSWFFVPSTAKPAQTGETGKTGQRGKSGETKAAVVATFALKNGFFVDACVYAVENPETAVVVVLDELNRCNIPKVLGDLLTVIEESKRAHWDGSAWVVDSDTKAVTLPYSGRKLFVPDNIFIVGTMNTTDRSVAPMDAALRRRFSFHRIWPQGFGPDAGATAGGLAQRLGSVSELKASLELWKIINTQLLAKYGADAMLGHSYLDDLRAALERDPKQTTKVVAYHWNHRILPQLMDVIASNGLTRSLVTNPQRFFGDENTQDIKKPGTYPVLEGKLLVDIAGEASLQSAAIRWPADS